MKKFLTAIAVLYVVGAVTLWWPVMGPRTIELFAQTVTQAPGAAGTTIQTTAPVTADTTISIGSYAGQVLLWLAAAFSVPVGTLLTAWLLRLFKLAGVETTEQMRKKLQDIIVNGLNAAAANNADRLQGMAPVQVKNLIVQDAIKYAREHGAETIKALGLDPNSGEATEAIKARIETAITDPTLPTPPILAPAGTVPLAAGNFSAGKPVIQPGRGS